MFSSVPSLIAEIVDLSSKEPGTLIYEYSLGEDGRSVHIVERYLTEGVAAGHIRAVEAHVGAAPVLRLRRVIYAAS